MSGYPSVDLHALARRDFLKLRSRNRLPLSMLGFRVSNSLIQYLISSLYIKLGFFLANLCQYLLT